MGLARELTMGPRKKRTRIASGGDWAVLRRMTAMDNPNTETFRTVLDRVAALPDRRRYAEAMVFIHACARYRELSGEDYGPELGTY